MSDAHLVDHNLREIQLKISASVIKTGAPCLDYLIAIKGGIGTANKRLGVPVENGKNRTLSLRRG
jgi:hypothetical protein